MQFTARYLQHAWRLPRNALLLGLPLTFALTGVAAHLKTGLPWLQSLLLAAILTRTDPVFAAPILGGRTVPARTGNLLNIESGLNVGLALPAVMILIAAAKSSSPHAPRVVLEVMLGIVAGIGVPMAAIVTPPPCYCLSYKIATLKASTEIRRRHRRTP